MDKKTILVVDDDRDVLEFVHEILTKYGYKSMPYSDTAAAMAVIASGTSLDLAIIDLIMPNVNGLELHAKIKQLRPGLPCIVVTGCSSVESYLTAINRGVFEYLHKPFRSSELEKVVAAALEKTAMMGGTGSERTQ